MQKLSRTERYQELRDRMDQETTAAAAADQNEPIKLTRSSRVKDAQALHATEAKPFEPAPAAKDSEAPAPSAAVIDELLGEVKQYNINNGNRIEEDTQLNIIHNLGEEMNMPSRRQSHLKTMETSDNAGGMTLDINVQNLETLNHPAQKAGLILGKKDLEVDDVVEEDNLELFSLGSDEFDKTIQQESVAPRETESRKAAKKKKKKAAPAEKPEPKQNKKAPKAPKPVKSESQPPRYSDADFDEAMEEEMEEEQKGSKVGTIMMVILIIALLVAIAFTIYLISQAGLF